MMRDGKYYMGEAEYRNKAWNVMVIWECMLAERDEWEDEPHGANKSPMHELWDNYGTNEMRNLAIDLEPWVEDVFTELEAVVGDDPLDVLDLTPFDWEFVPYLIKNFVTWKFVADNLDLQPAGEVATVIIAMKALNIKQYATS